MKVIRTLMLSMLMGLGLYLAWDRYYGAYIVRQQCTIDGGEKILRTMYSPGYLTTEHNYLCRSCVEQLARKQFDYIDAQVTQQSRPHGFFRYSLSPSGSNECEAWTREPEAPRLLRQAGLNEGTCVVVTALGAKPSGPALSQELKAIERNGVRFGLNQWLLTDESSHQVLAQIKDYYFTSKLTSALDMSGHGGNADENCMKGNTYEHSLATIASRVLRDTRQQRRSSELFSQRERPGISKRFSEDWIRSRGQRATKPMLAMKQVQKGRICDI